MTTFADMLEDLEDTVTRSADELSHHAQHGLRTAAHLFRLAGSHKESDTLELALRLLQCRNLRRDDVLACVERLYVCGDDAKASREVAIAAVKKAYQQSDMDEEIPF